MTVLDQPTRPSLGDEELRVDVYVPRHSISIDTLFWQHRSPFAAPQETLDELARDADNRAAARAAKRAYTELADYLNALNRPRPSVFDIHRPAIRRLKAIVHVGLIPLLWAITTCRCGDRWPCNTATQHLRTHLGWTIDITEHLTALTRRLPKPVTRWSRLWRAVTRQRTAQIATTPLRDR